MPYQDIKLTGAMNARALQRENQQSYNPEFEDLSEAVRIGKNTNAFLPQAEEPIGIRATLVGYGNSQYDDAINSVSQLDNIGEVRYAELPWYDTLANGVGKALGTAATTFLSSLVGLPAGLATAVSEGRFSGLWDNDVTNKLGEVDDWLENNMTNYKSRAQEENKWWQNLGTMNFWADDVIKNAGFTLGAAASMAVGAGSLGLLSKSLGFVNNVSKGAKMASAGVSALFSATGEGMIEARNGVEERNKLEMQRLEDALAPERNAIELEKQLIDQEYQQTGDYDTYRRNMTATLTKERDLNNRLESGRQEIEESGKLMGNKILLGNQVLLSAGNLIQFGKSIYKSFDRARHVAETASKLGKPFGVTAQRVSNEIKDGFKVVGKNFGRAAASTKGLLTEGSEEMNQQWIQNTSGLLEQRKDANDYWKAKLDPDAMKDSSDGMYTLGQAIAQGFDDSWGDIDQWEQFFIGGITGMAGTYMPTKLFNQDKTKSRWDPRRYGEYSGGAINEVREFNKQYNQFNENVNDLNNILSKEDFFERARDFVGHTYTETKKNEALENGDKKTWKDEDDKQIIHDIQAFYRAGKIDDLRAIYDEMGKNLSDDDVQNIIKSSTRETTDDEGKTKYIGAFVDENGNQIVSNDQIREEVKHNSEKLNEKLDSYLDSVYYVNQRTGGQLSKDQEDNLAYLHNVSKEKIQRADDIFANRRKDMPEKFLLKTNKSPEQLSKENQSSDLAFTKNEDTPEGYVEVDTSLINDKAYADFFIREVFLGGRRQDGKNISEEEALNAQEQSMVNLGIITDNYMTNYRNLNGTDNDIDTVDLLKDLGDAVTLYGEAAQFRDTLEEYMANPGKVDQDKKKEELKAEKKAKEDNAKNKFEGKSSKDIKQGISSGDVDFGEMNSFLNDVKSGKVSADQSTVDAVLGAVDIENKQNSLNGFLSNSTNATAVDDAKQMIDWAANSVNNADELSVEALEQFNADLLISDQEAAYMYEQGYTDLLIHEQAEARKQQALSEIYAGMEAWERDRDKSSVIPEQQQEGESGSFADMIEEDTGHDGTTKSPSNEGKNVPPPTSVVQNSSDPVTVNQGDALAALQETIQQQEYTPNDNGGTWRNTTRRYGRKKSATGQWYNTTVPYHETLEDKDSLLYKRSKAIYDFLNNPDVNAFENVENVGNGRIKPGLKIRFRAKSFAQEIFGKDFSELTDQEKKDSIVILMIDQNGNVLGDLPYPAFEPSMKNNNPTEEVKMLQGMYTKVSDALIAKNQKDGTTDAIVDAEDGLNMKFSDKSPYVGQIYEVKQGFAETSQDTHTLNEISGRDNGGKINPFTLAIKVLNDQINIGHKTTANVKAKGKIGQCYYLVPDASGRPLAMPFITPAFNPTQMRDTEFYKLLDEALTVLERYSDPKSNREERNRAIDTICSLLQIESPFLDSDSATKITFSFNRLGDERIKKAGGNVTRTKIEVAKQDGWKDIILSQLVDIPIQVSLRYINRKISVGNLTRNYNEVIGDIAFTNLPENTRHTVGTWFTIRNISETGPQKTKQTKYPEGVTRTYMVGGRNVNITSGNVWRATDPKTGEPINNVEVDTFMARMQAANKDRTTGRMKVDINGELMVYDIDADNLHYPRETPVLKTGTDSSAVAMSKPKVVNKDILDTTLLNPAWTVEHSKLNNKDKVISVGSNVDYPLYINIKSTIEGIVGVITWEEKQNRFRLSMYVDPDYPNPSTELKNIITGVDLKTQNRVINSIIPEDLRDYFTKGHYDEGRKKSFLFSDDYQKEHPEAKLADIIIALNLSNGPWNSLRDKWGIYFLNEYTGESNYPLQYGYSKPVEYIKHNVTPKSQSNEGEDFVGLFGWTPGTEQEAKEAQKRAELKQQAETQLQPETKQQFTVLGTNNIKTIEEAEKAAKALKITGLKTALIWKAIPENQRIALMNGDNILVTFNGVTKKISINSVQEMIKTLQEWNAGVKRNPDNFKSDFDAPFRRVDRERKKADILKERRWLLKNLPFFNTDERLNLIQGLIEIPGEENKAWGRFKQGIITLSDMAARGTLYHEAFHAVTQTLLSDAELDSLYENAVKRYKESDVALVEELLAEDFRRYVQRGETPIIGPILKFFRKIMNAIRNITNMNDPINQLFYRINNGEFRETTPRISRNGNAFYRVYGNKIQENLMRLKDSDAVKPIIDDFVDRNIIGDPYETAPQWREFKNYWKEQGVRVNGGWAYDALDGLSGYRLKEIYITEGGVEWSAEDLFEAESMMHKEDYATKQARRGAQLAQEWNRINKSSIQNLEEHQLSKDIWDNMSVREQEQWLECHS